MILKIPPTELLSETLRKLTPKELARRFDRLKDVTIVPVGKVGPRGCGKSLLLRLCGIAHESKSGYISVESSDMCDDHIKRRTCFGLELAKHAADRTKGGLYPDDLVVDLTLTECLNRLLEIEEPEPVVCLDAAGAFRSRGQRKRIESLTGWESNIIHIESTLLEVFEGVYHRIALGIAREDVAVDSILRSWYIYRHNVERLIDVMSYGTFIRMHKHEDLVDKTEKCLLFIDKLTGSGVSKCFADRTHPVHAEIRKQKKLVAPEIPEDVLQTIEDHKHPEVQRRFMESIGLIEPMPWHVSQPCDRSGMSAFMQAR